MYLILDLEQEALDQELDSFQVITSILQNMIQDTKKTNLFVFSKSRVE